MKILRKILSGSLVALLPALLFVHSVEAAAGNKAPTATVQKTVAQTTGTSGKAMPQQNKHAPCAQESQDCDSRTRSGRSRADTAARDHHSEGHD